MSIRVTHSGVKSPKPFPTKQPQRPFGMPTTPFNPLTGTYMPLHSSDQAFNAMRILDERDDYLVCEDEARRIVKVAKPFLLQRTPFDEETFDGVSYVYSDVNERVASKDGEIDEDQRITPSYAVNEKILAVRHNPGLKAHNTAIEWEDVNTAGRCWALAIV